MPIGWHPEDLKNSTEMLYRILRLKNMCGSGRSAGEFFPQQAMFHFASGAAAGNCCFGANIAFWQG